MSEDDDTTPGGSRVIRHESSGMRPVTHDTPVLDAVEAHVERHLGEVESVFHELVSTDVHLDVLTVVGA